MKSPVSVVLAAVGTSIVVPLSYLSNGIAIAVAGLLSSDNSGITYSIQHTMDDMTDDACRSVLISRTTTTATVTDPLHGMVSGDTVIIDNSGDANLDSPVDAQKRPFPIQVTVTDVNTYTYTVANTGAAASKPTVRAKRQRWFSLTALTGATTRIYQAFTGQPITGLRLIITARTAGSVEMLIIQTSGSRG